MDEFRKKSTVPLIGESPDFLSVLSLAAKFSIKSFPVLLTGETGTGKGLIARAIHDNSIRNKGPFLSVNCAALPDALIESNLFGYKKGAFTGAIRDSLGFFDEAANGSLFLDEIGEMSPGNQVKLLKVLDEEGEYIPVGGTEAKKSCARIIVATNRDLKKQVYDKKFREDLFYRLNVFSVCMPPVRERKKDIPLLVEYLLDKFNSKIKIADHSWKILMEYDWPGNIRELYNLIKLIVALNEDESRVAISRDNLSNLSFNNDKNELDAAVKKIAQKMSGSDIKISDITRMIAKYIFDMCGEVGKTANSLGITTKTLKAWGVGD